MPHPASCWHWGATGRRSLTVGLVALVEGLGVKAVLTCGESLSAGEARRLSCDA